MIATELMEIVMESLANFLLTLTSCFSSRLLCINIATEQTNREHVNARLVNAFMNVNGHAQRSILRSKILSSAPFCALFIRICSTKRKNAVYKPSLTATKPIWNAPECAFSAAFAIVSSTLSV